MRHRIFLHIVWTTLGRDPLIDHQRATFLRRHLRNVARAERAMVLRAGIVTTHLHLVVRIHPACTLSRLLQRWKGGSAMLCRRDQIGDPARPLRWAKGSSVVSVGPQALDAVLAYVADQPAHHPAEAIPPVS
jgi:REP element-mobilizing transposase RayT